MAKLLAVGRMKAGPERELFARYWERCIPLAKGLGFATPTIVELRESQAGSAVARRQGEAQGLMTQIQPADLVLAFDERGRSVASPAFAYLIANARDSGRMPCLVLGGPDGLDGALRESADHVLSFGAMTLPHQLARVLVAEQLYRAMTLLSGHPYHRA